jgi:hypothetical protein
MVKLCRPDGRYEAAQPLRAEWFASQAIAAELTGIEASVLWSTEGKGDEDLHVHYFQQWNDLQLRDIDLSIPQRITCLLPISPVSYEGTLLRIRWCVRLRMFRSGGREGVIQQPFQLVCPALPTASPLYS